MRLAASARFDILATVFSEISGVPKEAILSKSRQRDLADARAMISHLMRDEGYTLHQIADAVGRDHSTISHYSLMFPYLVANRRSRSLNAEFTQAVRVHDATGSSADLMVRLGTI